MVSIESLLQQLQNGGKKSIKRKPAAAAKAAKPVRARSASPVRRKPVRKPVGKPARPVKRRVFPKMRRSVGGFFEELNQMVAGQKAENKDKAGAMVAGTVNPVATAATAATPMAPPAAGGAMEGGRLRVFKKKAKKPRPASARGLVRGRRLSGGYEEEEEEQFESEEQEGGRRRVFKNKAKKPRVAVRGLSRGLARGRRSVGGYEEALEEQAGGRRRRAPRRSTSPVRRVRH